MTPEEFSAQYMAHFSAQQKAAVQAVNGAVLLLAVPGSGKTTVAMALAEKLRRPVLDSDAAVEETAGIPIPAIFEREEEAGFRRRETSRSAARRACSARIFFCSSV